MDDHKYGKRNRETGEWNGMMGELLAQVSILLTATYESSTAKKNLKAQRPVFCCNVYYTKSLVNATFGSGKKLC